MEVSGCQTVELHVKTISSGEEQGVCDRVMGGKVVAYSGACSKLASCGDVGVSDS